MHTILWDNDGVLIDSEGLFYQATRDTLAQLEIALTPELFRELSLQEGRSAFELAEAAGHPPDVVQRLRHDRDQAFTAMLQSADLVLPHVAETLHSLRGSVRMGVVTSAQRVHFETAHARSGLRELFDFVLTREDYARSKPHPDPYQTAVQRYDLDPQQCLVVEDSLRGLRSAQAAGLRCAVIPNAWTQTGDFRAAYRVLQDIRDVPALLAEWR